MTSGHKLFLSACTLLLGAALVSAGIAQAAPCFTNCPVGTSPNKVKCDHLDTPTIQCVDAQATASSITLKICAGLSGAPAGISIHWSTCAAYAANGNKIPGPPTLQDPNSPGFAISLSGNCNPNTVQWNLGASQCKNITINANTIINAQSEGCGASGNTADLACDPGCYVFEVFAHNDPGPNGKDRSCTSAVVECHTAACPTGDCTLTWGYWKTHGPEGCNPPHKDNLWPVNSLAVGGLTLDQSGICAIFQINPGACAKGGSSNGGANAVIILEHQLLAAMLNVANGAISCNFANTAITQANNLLVGFENACVGTSTPLGQQMVQLASLLETYNSDQCACPVQQSKPQASPSAPTNGKRSSWGHVKSIYR